MKVEVDIAFYEIINMAYGRFQGERFGEQFLDNRPKYGFCIILLKIGKFARFSRSLAF